MPCRSDYMEPTGWEKEYSKVLALNDELDGIPLPKNYGTGMDHRAYSNTTKEKLDQATANLCQRLQGLPIEQYSLEMQLWWRNHKAADRERDLMPTDAEGAE